MSPQENLEEMPNPTLPWTKLSETPKTFVIASLAIVPGKFGKRDAALTLVDDEKNLSRFDAWGENYHFLYNSFGPKADHWVGRKIRIHLESVNGKNRRIVSI